MREHETWLQGVNETQGTRVRFPVMADADASISIMVRCSPRARPRSFALARFLSHAAQLGVLDTSSLPRTGLRGINVDTIRSLRNHPCVFIVGPDRRVYFRQMYPRALGRNFYEVLRAVDSYQLTTSHKVETPANWCYGDDVIVHPDVTDELAADLFPKGIVAVSATVRMTPAPDVQDASG